MEKTRTEMRPDGIVVFTIQRPAVRNAIDFDVMENLKKVIQEVKENAACKALVITGNGEEAFCSGGDLSVFHGLHTKEEAYSMLSKMGHILYELLTLNRPTIALLNGAAVGGGCELATACDFRIARSGAKFGFVQGKLGITTGWGGGTMLLQKLTYDKACQLLYSAGTYTVEYGEQIGFIHNLIEDPNWKDAGIRWTGELVLNSSPAVLSSYKEIAVRKWIDLHMKDRMLIEIEQCSRLWESDEHHKAVETFLQKKHK
ncbi:enoyl-CoA hydratase/isomerase family protein [Bacillus sp. DJP31]|uniref:enoyl-CoA hydratase/isomerase family protein n=1 Tax=Bacillus sp. DJP31 TaxID=3409789 RepID=UPI003BB7181F